MSLFQKILVPVDGSSTSNKALEQALQIAQQHHSQLRLLHAIDELANLSSYEYSGTILASARQQAQLLLQQAQATAQAHQVPADTRLAGEAGQRLGQTVADEARLWGADLIVVGTHGRRGVGRVLLGSGAEQILRMAPVPVLSVRGE